VSLLLGIGTYEILEKNPKMAYVAWYYASIGFFALSIVFSLAAIRVKE
jgi:hypothetical protein